MCVKWAVNKFILFLRIHLSRDDEHDEQLITVVIDKIFIILKNRFIMYKRG